MSYRKIELHGKTYEYVIGKSNIHIKGFGDFSVKVHGNPVAYVDSNRNPKNTGEYIGTPATIRALILGKETPVKLQGGTIYFMTSPFSSEIYGKTDYLPFDADNHDRLAGEI